MKKFKKLLWKVNVAILMFLCIVGLPTLLYDAANYFTLLKTTWGISLACGSIIYIILFMTAATNGFWDKWNNVD